MNALTRDLVNLVNTAEENQTAKKQTFKNERLFRYLIYVRMGCKYKLSYFFINVFNRRPDYEEQKK